MVLLIFKTSITPLISILDIKDYTNVLKAWYLLKANFKLQEFVFFNDIIEKLLFLILNKCKNVADYITKFCSTVIKLKSFLPNSKWTKISLLSYFNII